MVSSRPKPTIYFPGMSTALVVSDCDGALFEIPELLAVSSSGIDASWRMAENRDFTRIPRTATLLRLPGRRPVGYDPRQKAFVTLKEYRGVGVWAAGCVLPAGYLSLQSPAFVQEEAAPVLPLYSYSALGWRGEGFVAAGTRVDRDRRFDPDRFSVQDVACKAKEKMRRFAGNRLVSHLVEHCVLQYGCPTARSFVMGDKECAIPVSRRCNASCLGCISHQNQESGVMASQHRIGFAPSVEEICQYAAAHLREVDDPIISFGQGCEGEPLLEAGLVGRAIRAIREETPRGIIHINTNGSLPWAVEELCKAGLNSIRISLISAKPETYRTYHKPAYEFDNVAKSIAGAKKRKLWVSINLLVIPGLTDRPGETKALVSLVRRLGPDMIQLRNLNIDPCWFDRAMDQGGPKEKPRGMRTWLSTIQKELPGLRLGCFNPSLRQIRAFRRPDSY